MRRFRIRRRFVARRWMALALPLATAIATTTAVLTLSLGAAAAQPATVKPKATLNAGVRNVSYGDTYRLHGTIPGHGQKPVMIAFRGGKSRGWSPRFHIETGDKGRYITKVRARKSGTFRAHSPGARASVPAKVRVHSRLKVKSGHSAVAGGAIPISGKVKPGDRGRLVKVKVGGDTLSDHTNGHGHFKVRWHAPSTGRYSVHVKAKGNRVASGSSAGGGHVVVFRHAVASWYGPGLYGGHLACGGTLQPGTLGVANKTLPCGTKVTLRYGRNQVTVPVIDRGPYVAGREYDLTSATRSRLGFPDVDSLLSSK